MKRLVTLGITLALVMGLFCFAVSAETVIQGTSDTVTATYGSNDITIALKARKLRVVNTGTAAAGYAGYTPIVVTVTIYNLGNQNCLINNLKFQLSSDSAEYTIAGFENISSDLFIADSAYDSNGYLSIHAINDYTYSGGIVCPANSNMTYVGIINVSANWITENQTWRTVDLSSANFYSNMTTTIGDYPYVGMPIQLDDVDILNDMLDSLASTEADVNTIRNVINGILPNLIFTGNAYNFTSSSSTYLQKFKSWQYNNAEVVRAIVIRRTGRPYLITVDVDNNSSTDSSYVNGTVRYPFYIHISNVASGKYSVLNESVINSLFPSAVSGIAGIYIDYFYSDLYSYLNPATNTTLYQKHRIGNKSYLGTGWQNTVILGHFDVPYNIQVTWPDFSIDNFFTNIAPYGDDIYMPPDEYTILRDLYIAYSSVNGIDDLSDAASDAADQAETIHNQEASYYAQNQAAIEATGLSNYQFSGEQTNGIGAVSNDFTSLWNALGSWNSVYIFSMTLTLALTILRHMPNRRRPKEDKKE